MPVDRNYELFVAIRTLNPDSYDLWLLYRLNLRKKTFQKLEILWDQIHFVSLI